MIKVGSFTIKLVPNYYISSKFVNILIKYVTIVIVEGGNSSSSSSRSSSGGGVAGIEVSSLRNFR